MKIAAGLVTETVTNEVDVEIGKAGKVERMLHEIDPTA
jgi:RNA-binding protein YhbY